MAARAGAGKDDAAVRQFRNVRVPLNRKLLRDRDDALSEEKHRTAA